jgi:drug/metabolite transporter (DMT)-like permease
MTVRIQRTDPGPLTQRLFTPHRTGIWCCATAMAILGCCVPITRAVLTYPNAAGQCIRYSIAAAVLIPLAARIRRRRPPIRGTDWTRIAVIAACGLVAFNLLLLTALRHGDPAVIATVLGCAPIALGVLSPLLRREPPTLRISAAAALVVAGTMLLNGLGHVDPIGIGCATGALAADLVFSLLAAPMLQRLGPTVIAAATCAMAVPMFAAAAVFTGELKRWRPPTVTETAVFCLLGLILTACAFLAWFHGLRRVGAATAGITIGIVPVAALAAASLQSALLPTPRQAAAVGIVAAGLLLATSRPRNPLPRRLWHRLRPAIIASGVCAVAAAGACGRPAPQHDGPDRPVREYFAALAAGDTTTAYRLSRSSALWLTCNGLAHGYQPPTNMQIIDIAFPNGDGANPAYVRVRYQLAGSPFTSTLELWKTAAHPPQWSINSGSTGRLDVISPLSPRVTIAAVQVTTPLTGPRISGGNPSTGYFEIPPGVYTVTLAPDPRLHSDPVQVAVPAMWRDSTPVSITINAQRTARAPPAPARNRIGRERMHANHAPPFRSAPGIGGQPYCRISCHAEVRTTMGDPGAVLGPPLPQGRVCTSRLRVRIRVALVKTSDGCEHGTRRCRCRHRPGPGCPGRAAASRTHCGDLQR